ncbi:5-hydroxytryptamine receptor 1-like [Eupeodes corollae]|uniref:5-hydroxytryptamine receptor 1-like n=1 Tax=Eupeodes corollae TaxID=290404 RepID=UPI00248F7A3C|nr:5-hydroxytryptamine receptor 1-like [Eupeodes corollae]
MDSFRISEDEFANAAAADTHHYNISTPSLAFLLQPITTAVDVGRQLLDEEELSPLLVYPSSSHNANFTTLIASITNSSPDSSAGSVTSVLSTSLEPLLDGPSIFSEFDGEVELPPLKTIIVSLILLVVILGTVVGNVLVCIAVCMVRKLRRPCNYLLVSLALSDLCVAVLVMPTALLYEVLQQWNYGPLFCDIWVSFDVLCCTASILNLCAISVDRYLAITKPLEYGVKRTPRRMMLCVALVWLAAACISLPPLLILGNEHIGENGEPICRVCQNFAYQIYATVGSFYLPLSVMLFVYYQIFRAARRIVREEKRAQTHLQNALNGAAQTQRPDYDGHVGPRHSGNSLSTSTCGGGTLVSGSSNLLGSPHQKKLRFQLAKEKKASTTLGIIMSAFTICWLPFFILALIRPFVESETIHIPEALSSLFLWLGYANSLLNPIIYATLNRDFRKPFQEILYFRCSSLNTMMRENYYQDQYGEAPSQRVVLGNEGHGARESFL